MFDFLPPVPQGVPPLDAVQKFFAEHGDELARAAGLLGGDAAKARIRKCGSRLASAVSIDPSTKRDLVALHQLLSLQNVGDPDRIETELFAAIHPASREAEEICLLTDRLSEVLRAHDLHDDGSISNTPPPQL